MRRPRQPDTSRKHSKEIADALMLSGRRVKRHTATIEATTGAQGRAVVVLDGVLDATLIPTLTRHRGLVGREENRNLVSYAAHTPPETRYNILELRPFERMKDEE